MLCTGLLVLTIAILTPSEAIKTFPLRQPFGQLKVSEADCCPYAGLQVLPKSIVKPRIAIVIGVQKAATTLLYQLLTLHPDIAVGETIDRWGKAQNDTPILNVFATKERHFFDRLPWNANLRELHAYARAFMGGAPASHNKVWLDATPDYVDMPSAACRIKAAFPQARLLVLLRDPVMRAFSQWRMVNEKELWKHLHYTPRGQPLYPFAEEVRFEMAKLASLGCLFNGSSPLGVRSWNDCFHCHFMHCGLQLKFWDAPDDVCDFANYVGILAKGLYAPQIAWWLNLFPPQQLMILNSEDLSRNQTSVMSRIFQFLGLSDVAVPEGDARAAASEVDAHRQHDDQYSTKHSVDALRDLYRFYAPMNEELYELLQILNVTDFTRFPTTLEEDE